VQCTESVLKDQLIGDPILPQHTCLVLLFMAYRGKMPIIKFVLLACLLFAVHPVLILTGLVMLQCLHRQMKAPKGKFTRGSLSKVSTIDAVVYGGGLRGLYTAALLARAGGKVTVLIPQSRCEGGATACLDGAPCDFILDRCEFGQVSRYETLLSVCLHASKPVIFEPIGDQRTGWAHGVLVVGDHCHPVPLRSGAKAWVNDLSRASGADRRMLTIALTQAIAVYNELLPFVLTKIPYSATLLCWLGVGCQRNETIPGFTAAACITVSEAASHITHITNNSSSPTNSHFVRSCTVYGLLREEHAPICEVSFAAWSASVVHGINGYHIPKGGISQLCASLQATVQANGGQVLTNACVRAIRLRDHSRNLIHIASTIGEFTADKLVLAVDAIECFRLIDRTKDVAGICPRRNSKTVSPSNLKGPSIRQVVRTLIAFPGTCKDLDAPKDLPIFWRKQSATCNDPKVLDCKTITLRDSPNGVASCVVEGPVSSLWVNAFGGNDTATDTRNRLHNDILSTIAHLFPLTRGRALYINTLAPSPRGFSHTPARYLVGKDALGPVINGLSDIFLALDDFAVSNSAGSVIAGYLAAHTALGYTRAAIISQLNQDLT